MAPQQPSCWLVRPGASQESEPPPPQRGEKTPLPRAGSRTHPCPAPPLSAPPRQAPSPRAAEAAERGGRWAPRGSKAGSYGGRRGQRLPQAPRGAYGGRARTGRPPRPAFRERPGRAGRGKRPPLGARRTRRAARAPLTAAATGAPPAGPASGDRKTTGSLPGNCLNSLKTGRSSGYPREREREKSLYCGSRRGWEAFRVGIPHARIATKPNAFFLLCLGVVCQC